MKLFTFILEYLGGTYISQVYAHDVEEALVNWSNKLEYKAVKGIGEKSYNMFINSLSKTMEEFPPNPIDTVKNVWRFSDFINNHFAVMHIIQTEE